MSGQPMVATEAAATNGDERRARLGALLDNKRIGAVADFEASSSTMLIAFGGMGLQIGIPPFEFFRMTGEIPVLRLFVRDTRRAWYHLGVAGAGDDVDQTAEYLRGIISRCGARRVVTIGNSAGGYAALLFGALLPADVVLAVSPQTYLDIDELWSNGDHRWDSMLHGVWRRGGPDTRYVDLGRTLRAMDTSRTVFQVHHSLKEPHDGTHAERLAGVENLELVAHQEGGHTLIKLLKKSEDLSAMLRGALG